MRKQSLLYLGLAAVGAASIVAASTPQGRTAAAGHLSGTVTSPSGPEAGVWVIAETRDLPTPFAKIVVTDDRGRYVVPDLPRATYNVWVRGYGLVDPPKQRVTTRSDNGTITLNLRAVPAPNAAAAAQYYPAGYWYSLLQVPAPSEFPGTGPEGNGISPNMRSQQQWVRAMKSGGCTGCHAMGNEATRRFPPSLGKFPSSVDAWHRRIQSGQAGAGMLAQVENFGLKRALGEFASWTDRIANGELPPVPPRPQGIERNVVITMWDGADPKAYMHDLITTDKRKPTVNPNGLIYGAPELSVDYMPVLDPVRHTATKIPLEPRDPNTPATGAHMPQPSPYYGWDTLWTSRINIHNQMIDEQGRVWMAMTVRGPENPAFCKEGSDHPSAKLTPVARAGRHLAVYDPKTKKLTHISTCFGTHHLMFAEDANHTLWTSGGGQVIGWLNTKMFDETQDEMKSQGWTALIRDANGNGKRDAY
ncbi:MAG TPA: carboxypeptidase-like regulatory domain-containing protein, partial [Vicinamibacterales bacterium]|nr:carboxypeptidase-like regulatory domain-containing protein [Vicinamibacterales bacterium]